MSVLLQNKIKVHFIKVNISQKEKHDNVSAHVFVCAALAKCLTNLLLYFNKTFTVNQWMYIY